MFKLDGIEKLMTACLSQFRQNCDMMGIFGPSTIANSLQHDLFNISQRLMPEISNPNQNRSFHSKTLVSPILKIHKCFGSNSFSNATFLNNAAGSKSGSSDKSIVPQWIAIMVWVFISNPA